MTEHGCILPHCTISWGHTCIVPRMENQLTLNTCPRDLNHSLFWSQLHEAWIFHVWRGDGLMNWEQNFPAAKVLQATIHPRLLQKTLTLYYSIAMKVKKSFLVSPLTRDLKELKHQQLRIPAAKTLSYNSEGTCSLWSVTCSTKHSPSNCFPNNSSNFDF